jgi:hypothetical protein
MSKRSLVDVPSKPFSIETDSNHGQMTIFTPTGEYPAELHTNATDEIKSSPVRVTKYVQTYLT